MAGSRIDVRFFDVVLCVSRVLDLLSATLSDHHLRAAYIGSRLAEELGLGMEAEQDVAIAGALHDVGAVSSALRHSLLDYSLAQYRFGSKLISENGHQHGMDSYLLLREIPLGSRIIAVADIFTAIAEKRPYREGMDRKQSLATLDELAVDGDIVALVRNNVEELGTLLEDSAVISSNLDFAANMSS